MKRAPITAKGAERLKAEVAKLKTVDRPRIVQDIATAREHGDLKENAEYHAAREQQSFCEGRIQEIEGVLSMAEVIDIETLNVGERVVFGATVTLEDLETEEEVTYQIVGDIEADIKEKRIAVSSPIARALIGKENGDDVVVIAPNGDREYEIIDVKYK
ncbi:MAG: transcription elongation factor GreA [Cocleimonas sp.]|nr:transcription elongation factor GreA [Cocleimonas sp.]